MSPSAAASQVRDTNNPAAQQQLTPEDILLMISRNKEKTRALLEDKKKRQAAEARARIAKESARVYRQAPGRFRDARQTTDAERAARLRDEGEQRLADLEQVNAEAWPWAPWMYAVRDTDVIIPEAGGAPVYEGLRVARARAGAPDQLDYLEFGQIVSGEDGDKIGVRAAGSPSWQLVSYTGLLAGSPIIPSELPRDGGPMWPDDDQPQLASLQTGLMMARSLYDFGETDKSVDAFLALAKATQKNPSDKAIVLDAVLGFAAEQKNDLSTAAQLSFIPIHFLQDAPIYLSQLGAEYATKAIGLIHSYLSSADAQQRTDFYGIAQLYGAWSFSRSPLDPVTPYMTRALQRALSQEPPQYDGAATLIQATIIGQQIQGLPTANLGNLAFQVATEAVKQDPSSLAVGLLLELAQDHLPKNQVGIEHNWINALQAWRNADPERAGHFHRPHPRRSGRGGYRRGLRRPEPDQGLLQWLLPAAGNQIRVGDVVEAGGKAGLVEELTLRYICMRDYEGNVHFVSNGLVSTVTNRSRDFAYAVIDVGVAYRESVDAALARHGRGGVGNAHRRRHQAGNRR